MKFYAPNSYTNDPGILTLENGDPSIDEIRRVFREKGLDVIQKGSLIDLEVTISKPKRFLKNYLLALYHKQLIYICKVTVP